MTGAIASRFSVPAGAQTYRNIGPFDAASLPTGLLREHRLKQGTWARLSVIEGRIGFAWDDTVDEDQVVVLGAGDTIDVPPQVPHHLVECGSPFRISIEFLSE